MTTNIKHKEAITALLDDPHGGVFASFTEKENAYHVTAPALNLDHITVFEELGLKIVDIRPDPKTKVIHVTLREIQ